MRKGQAAMEFMMTYGWAVVALLVMIGALAYFGVLNPGRYFPDKCLFGTGFNCKDYQAKYNGGNLQLQFTIENKIGDAITLQAVNASTVVGGTTYSSSCTGGSGSFPTSSLDVDASGAITCTMGTGTSGPAAGQPVKFTVIVTYIGSRGVYNHTVNGDVQTKVQ